MICASRSGLSRSSLWRLKMTTTVAEPSGGYRESADPGDVTDSFSFEYSSVGEPNSSVHEQRSSLKLFRPKKVPSAST
jgi:hypothetical protein